ncbi:hypothetical protein [Granulicatella sp. zg-ZJ]|nr:hypothetical protein [Granulicatella sp. zg-ZJ]
MNHLKKKGAILFAVLALVLSTILPTLSHSAFAETNPKNTIVG